MRFLLFFLLLVTGAEARDLTKDYQRFHKKRTVLSWQELSKLSGFEFALVPGILAESFVRSDHRSGLDFSLLTKDYFGTQLRFLEERGLKVRRVYSSSLSVDETKEGIHEIISTAQKKVVFITHSLGGMGLLDYLLSHEESWGRVGGVIFLQSPFGGAPIASVLDNSPWPVKKFLEGAMSFFHTSEETLDYLTVENRRNFIEQNRERIWRLAHAVPILTVAGVANGHLTLFMSSANIIRTGCPTPVLGKCLVRVYEGPFDDNDGMVSVKSSKLPDTDFLVISGADHGETVVEDHVSSMDRERFTQALLKVFVPKLK